MKGTLLHLRVFKGVKILKDESGNIANENQIVKLVHGSFEYKNFMNNVNNMGFGNCSIEKAFEIEGFGKYKEILPPKEIEEEIKQIFSPIKEAQLTPEQKKIKELEDKINSLTSFEDDALKKARLKYQEVFGKKGSPKWTVEEIEQKIAEVN